IQIFMVGVVIGLVGAGGGFLIIPALVYLARLPMKKAVGTSIFIIAINSLIGFTGDIGNIAIDWRFLFIFSFISILGIFAGIYLNKFINEKNLKKGFGWFVLTMSILILTKELLF
ncbi:MAG: permease, partial [Flavobacterium johnsoniae]